jgi:RNA 3'-terminal phosphate cyclase
MNIPLLKLPIPGGGSTVLMVNQIIQATTNSQNPEWTDVHLGGMTDVTVDMSVDAFFAAWLMMLQDEDFEDAIREITGSDLH